MAKPKLLTTLLREKKLTTADQVRKFLVGKTIKVISTNNGHNYTLGSTHVVTEGCQITNSYISGLWTENGYAGNAIYFSDCSLLDNTLSDLQGEVKSLESQKKDIEKSIETYKEKIAFMEETKATTFETKTFTEYKLKKLFSSSEGSTEEKVKQALALLD